jgi:hypothetical protein
MLSSALPTAPPGSRRGADVKTSLATELILSTLLCGVEKWVTRDRGTWLGGPRKFSKLFLHADQPAAGACWELKYSSTAAVYQA